MVENAKEKRTLKEGQQVAEELVVNSVWRVDTAETEVKKNDNQGSSKVG